MKNHIVIEAFLETDNPNVNAKSILKLLSSYCQEHRIDIIELLINDDKKSVSVQNLIEATNNEGA